jgi:hypothetical protein
MKLTYGVWISVYKRSRKNVNLLQSSYTSLALRCENGGPTTKSPGGGSVSRLPLCCLYGKTTQTFFTLTREHHHDSTGTFH